MLRPICELTEPIYAPDACTGGGCCWWTDPDSGGDEPLLFWHVVVDDAGVAYTYCQDEAPLAEDELP